MGLQPAVSLKKYFLAFICIKKSTVRLKTKVDESGWKWMEIYETGWKGMNVDKKWMKVNTSEWKWMNEDGG